MPTPQEPLYPETPNSTEIPTTRVCACKTCPLAGIPQPLDNFHRNVRCRLGRVYWCKVCRNAYARSHPSKPYTPKENEPQIKVCSNNDCVFNGDPQPITSFFSDLSKSDGLNSQCKTCVHKRNKEWQNNHPGWYKKYDWKAASRRCRTKDWARFKIRETKSRAKMKGIPFNLEREDLLPLPVFCPVFGIKMDYTGGTDRRIRASLDRIIPDLGYTKGNVRVISFAANTAKQNGIGDLISIRPPKNNVVKVHQPSLFDDQ